MNILVTGGAGYVGAELVPALLEEGHKVTVLDLYMFGEDVLDRVQDHPKLIKIKGDIRNPTTVHSALKGCDTMIHLACISNDPSFEINPALGKSINLDAFEPLVKMSKAAGVNRFIYASSSSVYGVKEEPEVTEDIPLEPLTDYSRFKAECEGILFRHMDDQFVCVVYRPATVCGYSHRQRLDVVVNLLTNLAYNTGVVKVFGGHQKRPNIHIKDMVRAYLHLLKCPPEKIQGKIFNVGYENHTVRQLGEMVHNIVGKERQVNLVTEPTNDNRSYHVSSKKIAQEINFHPQHTIEEAIEDLLHAFKMKKLPNSLTDIRYSNLKTVQAIRLK